MNLCRPRPVFYILTLFLNLFLVGYVYAQTISKPTLALVEDSGTDTSDKTTNAIDENSNIQTSTESQVTGTPQDFADYLVEGYWIDDNKLSRRDYRINTAGTITYNINNLSDYYKSKALLALKFWSDATGLQFVEEPTYHNADLRFTDDSGGDFTNCDPNVGRYNNYCRINIESYSSRDNPERGDFPNLQSAFVHEIGHGLGIGHPGDYNGNTYSYDKAKYTNDSYQMSVMSYIGLYNHPTITASVATPVTPMPADVRAIRDIYGTTKQTRVGDTTYGYNSTEGDTYDKYFTETGLDNDESANANAILMTIIDDGGTDTIDLSEKERSGVGVTIDLRQEAISSTRGTGNLLISDGTIIENAIGSNYDDTLIGNKEDNRLKGNGGNDTIDGAEGYDTAVYESSLSSWTRSINNNGDLVLTKNGETDTVKNIEEFEFNNVSYNFGQVAPAGDVASNSGTTASMNVGDTFGGVFENNSDVDWIEIDLLANTEYVVDLYGYNNNSINTHLRIHNSNSTKIAENNGASNSSVTFTTTSAGAHYISAGTQTVGAYEIAAMLSNVNAPVFISPDSIDVDTTISSSNRIYTITATDYDTDNDDITFSLLNDNYDGLFQIDSKTGRLSLSDDKTFDYATFSYYTLQIQASDGTNTATQDLTLTLIDKLDIVDHTATKRAIEPDGHSIIGKFDRHFNCDFGYENVDRDWIRVSLEEGRIYTITLAGDENEYYDTLLSIYTGNTTDGSGRTKNRVATNNDASNTDHSSKIIFTATETRNYYIEASNHECPPEEGVAYKLSVTLNNAPPVFTSNTTATVAENINDTETIYTATATDADSDDTVTFSLTDDAGGLFEISGGVITLVSGQTLDYENEQSHTITIQATDGTDTTPQNVTITVTNIADTPPVFTSNTTATAAENQTNTDYTAAATPDVTGTTITYSISGGADQALFQLSGAALNFKIAPDYEAPAGGISDDSNDYVVEIQASDGTNSATQTVTVTVTDIDEIAPSKPTITLNDDGDSTVDGMTSDSNLTISALENGSHLEVGRVTDSDTIWVSIGTISGTSKTIDGTAYGKGMLKEGLSETASITNNKDEHVSGDSDFLPESKTLPDAFYFDISTPSNLGTGITSNGPILEAGGTTTGITFHLDGQKLKGAIQTGGNFDIETGDIFKASTRYTIIIEFDAAGGVSFYVAEKDGDTLNHALKKEAYQANVLTVDESNGWTDGSNAVWGGVSDGSQGNVRGAFPGTIHRGVVYDGQTYDSIWEENLLISQGEQSIIVARQTDAAGNVSEMSDPIMIQMTLSVDTTAEEELFYTNPVTNQLGLESQSTIKAVSIYTLSGQKVLERLPNTAKVSIDVSNLSKGLYMMKIFTQTNSKTVKLIKR